MKRLSAENNEIKTYRIDSEVQNAVHSLGELCDTLDECRKFCYDVDKYKFKKDIAQKINNEAKNIALVTKKMNESLKDNSDFQQLTEMLKTIQPIQQGKSVNASIWDSFKNKVKDTWDNVSGNKQKRQELEKKMRQEVCKELSSLTASVTNYLIWARDHVSYITGTINDKIYYVMLSYNNKSFSEEDIIKLQKAEKNVKILMSQIMNNLNEEIKSHISNINSLINNHKLDKDAITNLVKQRLQKQ